MTDSGKTVPPGDDLETDEALMDELMQALEPIEPPAERADALRAKVLNQVKQESGNRLDDLLTVRADEGIWIPVGRGVRMKQLHVDKHNRTRSFLLRLEPGASLPAHQHLADEECIVLEGEARLGEVTVRAGDYHLAPRGVPHGVVSSDTGALLFLRADASRTADWVLKMLKHSVTSWFSPPAR